MDPRIVFMGSPDFAVPSLRALAEQARLVGVVTQPDRPAGRGQVLTPCPVKSAAESYHLEILQPQRLNTPENLEKLTAWKPDVIVVAAYGQILRQNILDLPRYGCINVHASLLPRWRGAAPIHAAILSGDLETGVTIMRMDAGIDTGDMLSQRRTAILPEDNAEKLTKRLAELGAGLLMDTLPDYLAGKTVSTPQDASQATYAPMLKKEEGLLDFQNENAEQLARRVRAFYPWPGAYLSWRGQSIKVLQAEAHPGGSLLPGKTGVYKRYPAVGAREGFLILREVQPGGKKPMQGNAFLNGVRDWGAEL